MLTLSKKFFLISSVIVLSSCSFVKNSSSNISQPNVSKIVDENIPENDIIINMAVLDFDNYKLEQEVLKEFNEADNGYHINVIDYAESYDFNPEESSDIGESYTAADMRIVQDILNKDDIDMTLNLLTIERVFSLAQKGAFVDFNELIKSDTDKNAINLNEHILELCEIDSKLYYMPFGYSINTLYGYEEYVGKIDDWNISSMKANWKKMPEGSLFSKQHMGGVDTASGIFYDLCMNCVPSFINYKNNKCRFDSDEFIELLDFTKEFKADGLIDKSKFVAEEYFLSTAKIDSFECFQEYLYDYGRNKKISFVGYPSTDCSNSFVSLYGDAEICAKASKEVQKGAWEFIKLLISEKIQNKMFFPEIIEDNNISLGFPINNDSLKNKADELISNNNYNTVIYINGNECNMGNFTSEQYDILKEVINNTNHLEFEIGGLYNIIYEEVELMIDGDQSSAQTAKNIQSRASILLSE